MHLDRRVLDFDSKTFGRVEVSVPWCWKDILYAGPPHPEGGLRFARILKLKRDLLRVPALTVNTTTEKEGERAFGWMDGCYHAFMEPSPDD